MDFDRIGVLSLTPSGKAKVGVSFCKNLDVQHVEDPLVMQREDPLKHKYMRRIYRSRLIKASVLLEGVHRDICLFTRSRVSVCSADQREISHLSNLPRLDIP
jgi:hypothetical protein